MPAYFLLCLSLGGASAAGYWANTLLQLVGILILYWAFSGPYPDGWRQPDRDLKWLIVLAVALVVVQLVPMPPVLWAQLPGRAPIRAGYELLNVQLPWLPISLAPDKTMYSALSLLPALAVFIGILKLGGRTSRKWISWAMALAVVLSLPLGLLQTRLSSSFYFYEVSDFGWFTGFFANASHFPLLLLTALPLLVGPYFSSGGDPAGGTSLERSAILAALAAVIAGLVLSASPVAVGLAVPVLIACVCMVLRRKKRISSLWSAVIALFALSYVAVGSFVPFEVERVWSEPLAGPNSRHRALASSIVAAVDYLPAGSGIGTFPDIYRRYEDANSVSRLYLNHVHNDYIELALETGLPGLALITAFLYWWVQRTYAIWSSSEGHLARAATIASGTILVQSALDYPLRTAAIGVVFGACCALMAQPRGRARAPARPDVRGVRHLSAD